MIHTLYKGYEFGWDDQEVHTIHRKTLKNWFSEQDEGYESSRMIEHAELDKWNLQINKVPSRKLT